MWREGYFRRGGFELYSIYFAWALFTISYSLARDFSILRLLDATLVFSALSVVVFALKDADEVTRLIERFVIGCGFFVVLLAISALALPRSITWDVPDLYTLNQQVERFRGLLNNPNDVGGLMLITVGPTLAFWSCLILAEEVAGAYRAPVGRGSGNRRLAHTLHRTDGRDCLLCAVALSPPRILTAGASVLAIAALPLLGHSISEYTGRGDVTTLTGRTEMWAYVVQEIKRRPFVGYGYEVAGMIFQSKYFPIWFGPWDEGAQEPAAQWLSQPRDRSWHSRDTVLAIHHAASMVVRAASERRPLNLKMLALLVVIPCLIHNMSEASIGDFLGMVGLLFGLSWAIGERYRLLVQEQAVAAREKALDLMPPGVAALQTLRA